MKILLTGSNGFIGKKLLARLATLFGNDSICLLTSKAVPGFECIVYKNHRSLDVSSYDVSKVDVIIHAGAFTPKNGNEANLVNQCNDNVCFTEQLLSLQFEQLRKVIYLSTLDVYANNEIISEASIVEPVSFYGMSKLYCEKMIKFFAINRKIHYQILRIGHVYGPGEEEYKKMLPLTINNVVNNRAVEIWGDGSELRSFIYIDDVVTAIINSIEKAAKSDVVNIVSGHAISIKDLVASVIQVSAKKIDITFKESSHIKRNLVFDNSALRSSFLEKETDFLTGLTAEYKYMEAQRENNI